MRARARQRFDTFVGLFGSQYDNYTSHSVGAVDMRFGGWQLRDLAQLDRWDHEVRTFHSITLRCMTCGAAALDR